MKTSMVPLLRCPGCRQSLALVKSDKPDDFDSNQAGDQIVEGQLVCRCGRSYTIREGIPNLIYPEDFSSSKCRFRFDRLSRLSQIEGWHFWFIGRRALISRLLAKHLGEKNRFILDLGCGTGMMVEVLMRQGYQVLGVDLRPEGLCATHQALPWSWLLQAEATKLPLADNIFDAVLLLDVLEHVDEQVLLQEVYRVLRPGGLVLITVPAIPWLWSSRDQAACHLRRYTRNQLKSMLEEGRLKVTETRYYQCLLFPLILITRLLGRRSAVSIGWEERLPAALNALMSWINKLEVKLGNIVPWPWGSTLVAVCERR